MNTTNTNLPGELDLDLAAACRQIETLLQEWLAKLHREGAVIGLSGGLDSAVAAALAVRALGKDQVTALNMPEQDSSPLHKQHARMLAGYLGITLKIKPVTPMLKASGSYRLLPLRFLPVRQWKIHLVNYAKSRFLKNEQDSLLAERLQYQAESWVARGNAYAITKHRMRMVTIYQYADLHNLMVVGAANRTELMTGTYAKWGVDHCADVMPIVHLYRSQVEALAAYLGLPAYIRTKPADPDVIPGVNNKGELLGDFTSADLILQEIERGAAPQQLYSRYSQQQVDQIFSLFHLSEHMRHAPISLLV